MLESVRSLTTLFDAPLQLPPAAFHLLIMGPDLFLAQALPKTGADGAVLTMLGLALIASGAAVRTAARD